MDSLTQIVLGASVGEAVLGKKAGNRAPLWGAVAGTIPDLDVIPGKLMETVAQLEFHRGPSHSITFAVLAAPLLGWLVSRIYKNKRGSVKEWSMLFFWGLFTHPLLDCFTTWGTELFWPFSEYRVALKSIFVIDPLYTLPFLICLIVVLFKPKESLARRKINYLGLGISCLYLVITLFNKASVNTIIEDSLRDQNISFSRYETRPAPLNSILWAANVETPDSFLIGYYSFLDPDEEVNFSAYLKNHHLLEPVRHNEKVETLVQITNSYFTIEQQNDTLIMNDLRFGQATDWTEGGGEFVFAYLISKGPDGEVNISQKPQKIREGRKMLGGLWKRVLGDK